MNTSPATTSVTRNVFCHSHIKIIQISLLFLLLLMSTIAVASQPLINGGVVTGRVSYPGETESYTFTSSAGQNVQLRITDTGGTSFSPRITLYDPTGAYVTYGQGTNVGAISHTTTQTGTYTVIAGDVPGGADRIGKYNIYFVHMPGANEGGSLINGGMISEAIDKGDLDSYTFAASPGENVQLRITDTSGNSFSPRMTLYDPSGAYVTYGQGTNVGAISHTTTQTGTYTVVVSDISSGFASTGNYNLYFVHMPGANEGGSLINGGMISEAIDKGDLDSYTFAASPGENIQIRITDTSGNSFSPRMTLYDPSGAYVTYGQGTNVGAISHTTTQTGTYTVVVSDISSGFASTGNYNLYFVHMPGANEGGSLINGGMISEAIEKGDLDSYTFAANPGENVQLRITDTSGNSFSPRMTLYDPSGAYVTYGQGTNVGAISHTTTQTGTYTVVVSDISSGFASTGNYNLYFVHMPGANEGGSLINGGMISEAIDKGDLDSYTFTASPGENIQLRITDTSGNSFSPRMTLYDPSGAYVTYGQGTNVGAISYKITQTGTYTVVVSDISSGFASTGNYNLYFVQMPGANEGGNINGTATTYGTIDMGDLDSYTFNVIAGQYIQLRITDTSNSSFSPRITLYSPTGAYVTYGQGTITGVISNTTTMSGTYTVVVSDISSGNASTGNYSLAFE